MRNIFTFGLTSKIVLWIWVLHVTASYLQLISIYRSTRINRTLGEKDSGCLTGLKKKKEKQWKNTYREFDYWPPNRGRLFNRWPLYRFRLHFMLDGIACVWVCVDSESHNQSIAKQVVTRHSYHTEVGTMLP